MEMRWVTIDDNLIKITRLANLLANNGFILELQNNNLVLNVPAKYNYEQFIKSIPIANNFLIKNRTIIIEI